MQKCLTNLARIINLCILHHSAWARRLVTVILYGSKQHLPHLSFPDVWAGSADQHLQIGGGCPWLHQGRVLDGGDVGQIGGGAFPVYQ